ncbi:hypothetical protein C453_05349 [Haloferax elongans ATCC BAA-1513]|uniref:Uncharacterized protein n=1 Tax=Haloferax elongans ATCC BAA-1513 TaxID=1230453 RepID=M0HTD4_HALEO|nr:hypothetical protein [Haloferax elongans]ELZ87751.1 hypothetical protein C453_05349 [Haloferax elongans ATCC BAA-1513]
MTAAPDHSADERPPLSEQLGVRLRLVGTALVAGVVVATVSVVAATVLSDPTASVETAFALGSLLFGFGLLGWSGAVALGRGIESMQETLDTQTGWTEPDARRAMARIIGFGLGVMLGTMFVGSVVLGLA